MEKPNPKCNQCGGSYEMQRIEGIFALTRIEKNKESDGIQSGLEGISFRLASGIPVVIFICPNCGELKIYPAKLFGEI